VAVLAKVANDPWAFVCASPSLALQRPVGALRCLVLTPSIVCTLSSAAYETVGVLPCEVTRHRVCLVSIRQPRVYRATSSSTTLRGALRCLVLTPSIVCTISSAYLCLSGKLESIKQTRVYQATSSSTLRGALRRLVLTPSIVCALSNAVLCPSGNLESCVRFSVLTLGTVRRCYNTRYSPQHGDGCAVPCSYCHRPRLCTSVPPSSSNNQRSLMMIPPLI
jgi:hypothetical protein